MPVHVEWVGHACFRIRRDGGPTIVTDPYTQRNVSLPEDTTIEGDTVIVSSLTDRAHGNPNLVRGNPRVINALDLAVAGTEAQVEGSPLITLKVSESEMHESGSPKDNAMYALKVGGLWILHQCCPGKVAPTDGKSLPLNVLWPVLPGNDLKSRGRKWPPERSIPTRHNGG